MARLQRFCDLWRRVPERPRPDPPAAADEVWYFAYGSNLHPEKLGARADVHPREVAPGVLRGWRLSFDMAGLPGVEPSMASLTPDPEDAVHGLLIRMSGREITALTESEGGHLFYERVAVSVDAYDGRRIEALTFRGRAGMTRREVAPSRRYLNLIREGARYHGLDEAWLRRLDALPEAGPPTPLGRLVMRLLLALDRPENRRYRRPVHRAIAGLARLEGRLRALFGSG